MKTRPWSTVGRVGRWATFLLLVALSGCRSDDVSSPTPSVLRIGVLPDQSAEQLRRRHGPLVRYLGEATGLELELVVPDDYADLAARFRSGELQLAWFGGVTFLRVEREAGARPLVMRDVDLEFTSSFVVADSASARSFAELAGASIAFGPRMSTSGHVMPRFHFRRLGISPEEFFGEVRYSRGHDETLDWIRDGEIDVGAINSVILKTMLREGRLSAGQIRVLDLTPSYRNYVWAVPEGLDAEIRIRLLDAFLALDVTSSEHAEILALQGARGYVPASSSDFEELRIAAAELEIADFGWQQ